MDWNVVEAFFNTETGKKLIKEALDKDQYWDKSKQGPSQDEIKVAHPGGGVTTQVSNPGKGGEGVYDVKKSDVKATGPSADAHVETLDEVHEVIDDVARRDPKGVQGKKVEKFTKTAEEKDEKEAKKDLDKAEIAIDEAEIKLGKPEKEEKEHIEEEKKEEKKEASLLEKLVRIANVLDEKGLTDEANMIDAIIQEETKKA